MSKEFYARLAEIQRTLNAPKNQYNSFGKYNYRSCEDILEGVKPLLQGMFLSISDEIVPLGSRFYVKATATITDGESTHTASAMAREEESKKGMDAAQVTGATSSYARKYCLNGLFAIDDSKDSDSNKHKLQQDSAPRQPASRELSPPELLNAFTRQAESAGSPDALKSAFANAWKQLDKTPQQAQAKEVYELRKSEMEQAA